MKHVKLCECGCGRPAPISKVNYKRLGYVKGEPMRFIRGHATVGKKFTKEVKERMLKNNHTMFKKGHKSFTDGLNLLKYQKRENHWNWKGGITPEIMKLRRCDLYIQWRKAVFSRDDFTCQICGKRGCYLEADHFPVPFCVLFRDKDYKTMWDISNGRTLCKECHNSTKKFWKDTYENNA